MLPMDERRSLCLCLICLTFPITYDLLIALAQGLKVQPLINKNFISQKVMMMYGSNRTVDIAIDALLPMVIELKAIKRAKVSIYNLGDRLVVRNNFLLELLVYTDIILSGSKSTLISDLSFRPWLMFFDLPQLNNFDFKNLIAKRDSAIGQGYLTI
jgi:hypothetical protein